jgi:murein DD-endopeptidase MepM/ murein hydrolase activator NlpD
MKQKLTLPMKAESPVKSVSALRRATKKLLPLILLLFVASAWAGRGARPEPDAGQLTRQLNSIQSKKADLKQHLREVKQKQRVVTAQLTVAERRLANARARLQDVSQQLTQSRAQLRVAKTELNESATRLDQHEDALGERLELIHQRGETSLLQILLESSSYSDLVNQMYLYDQVMSQDADLLDEYEQAKAENAAAAQAAAETELQVSQLKDQAATSNAVAAKERENTAAIKRNILKQRAYYERALAELEQDSRDIQAMLRRMQATPAGQKRLAEHFNGNFLRPVGGRITSGFGYRMHPILGVRKKHTGVDIGAASGTPIKAAADGVIIHAARWGGYGNCIIIDHGQSTATLYGHCSSLAVSRGQQVNQGQVIGYVGSTGLSTGPHLHFEVRRNGTPVNPGL